ncbi:MAG: methyl-accepting chemotaxis protein [Pseudomonadota bacterium]
MKTNDKSAPPSRLPLIGRLSLAWQFQILGTLLSGLLIAAGMMVYLDSRKGEQAMAYLQTAGEMQVLAQRMAKAAVLAAQGDASAPQQVQEARDQFAAALALLSGGGVRSGVVLPPSSQEVQPLLQVLRFQWPAAEKNATAIVAQQKILADMKHNAAAADPGTLAVTLRAAAELAKSGDTLMLSAQKLVSAYREEVRGRSTVLTVAALFGAMALAIVVLFGKIMFDDARRRFEQNERENRRNQDAILRLLDEISTLAEGDLTVCAQVSEELTGAIADAINYTVDELRTLVAGINKVTREVATMSTQAQEISTGLLQAAQAQAQDIQRTTAAVQSMAQSVAEVSANAEQSAKVAEQSLATAERGAQIVQDTVHGMNETRAQIQETAKRIKRLGESSQEIGEIVDMISDLTEQTNVLALNAAIQATSAGEAGRGFTIVAEEVQRLAERSAEATQQIAAIVKTIQGDTQDAIAAMEKSTRGVVEGAKLSESAGRALADISHVSHALAELSAATSAATRTQAESADTVAKSMRAILEVTQQTTQGTRMTAASVAQLASLAAELENSVAGFKLS